MRGALSGAENNLRNLGTTAKQLSNIQIKFGLNTAAIEQANRALDKMETRGMGQVAGGMMMAAPLVSTIKAAGDFQDVMQELKIVTYDSTVPLKEWEKQAKALGDSAKKVGADTAFSATEAGDAYVTLMKGGLMAKDVLSGTGEATVKLAQASGMLPAQVADSMVKVGNAYNIQGKEMLNMADFMSRVDAASTASISSLTDGYKYASATASQLGISYKDTGTALAVLNNRGLDGTTAGTNLADMFRRLAPTTRMSAAAMKELGLTTADVTGIKRGASRMGLAGKDLFHDESGKLKPMVNVVKILRDHTKGLRADVVQVAFTEMFGVEGSRAALALLKEGKGSWEEVEAATKRSMGLNERIAMQQKTYNKQMGELQEKIHNLLVSGGTPMLDTLTKIVVKAQEFVEKIDKLSKEHPGLMRWLMYTLGALVGFNIMTGAARIGIAIFGKNLLSVIGMFARFGGGAMAAGRGLVGFWNTFKYFRQGTGIMRALWSAVAFGHPILTKIGLVMGRLGGWFMVGMRYAGQFGLSLLRLAAQGMIFAIRMAAAWLIALGPVGWIILGVSAIIAGAILAWKTNFLGFRDKMTAVWDFIRTHATQAWEGMKKTAQAVWDWLKGLPGQALEWGRNLISSFARGIKEKVEAIPEALKEAAGKIKAFLGFSSPTRSGPGSEADRWAPAFISMYASGLLAGRARVAVAAAALAGAMIVAPMVDTGMFGHAKPAVAAVSRQIVSQVISPALPEIPASLWQIKPQMGDFTLPNVSAVNIPMQPVTMPFKAPVLNTLTWPVKIQEPKLFNLPEAVWQIKPQAGTPVLPEIPGGMWAIKPLMEKPTYPALPAGYWQIKSQIDNPAFPMLPKSTWQIVSQVISPALPEIPASLWQIKPQMGDFTLPNVSAVNIPMQPVTMPKIPIKPAGLPVENVYSKAEINVNIRLEGTKPVDESTRRIVEKIGPEIIRYLEKHDRYLSSRDPRKSKGWRT
jgi:TP901 family phage tail tape measure protein